MQICTENPVLFDSDTFMYANGLRLGLKRGSKSNLKRKREKKQRRAARAERREARVARREGRDMPQSAAERPTPRRRPTPKRTTQGAPQGRTGGRQRPPLTPLPEGLTPKQGVMANKTDDKPKSNTLLYVVGGVAVLGILGFIFLRNK